MKVVDFGAFVNFFGAKDGLVHVSQISSERVDKVSDVLTEGQDVKVKLLGFDDRGKTKLSMKVVDQETGEDLSAQFEPSERDEGGRREGGGDRPRGDRDRGPRREGGGGRDRGPRREGGGGTASRAASAPKSRRNNRRRLRPPHDRVEAGGPAMARPFSIGRGHVPQVRVPL